MHSLGHGRDVGPLCRAIHLGYHLAPETNGLSPLPLGAAADRSGGKGKKIPVYADVVLFECCASVSIARRGSVVALDGGRGLTDDPAFSMPMAAMSLPEL